MNGVDYDLTGYFYWVGSGNQTGAFGRENFTGTLFSDNTIELTGFELVAPTNGIVLGIYSGLLSSSGIEIINGRWGPVGTGISGSWSAIQTVPVPAAIWLFASGIFGLIGFSKYKS